MTQYRRQYRSTPRPPSIEGADLIKAMGILAGFVALCWFIVFY